MAEMSEMVINVRITADGVQRLCAVVNKLNAAAYEARNTKSTTGVAFWSRKEMCDLMAWARDELAAIVRTNPKPPPEPPE